MSLFKISNVKIQIIIKFGTVKSMNTYLKAKNLPPLHTKRILNLFIDLAAPN